MQNFFKIMLLLLVIVPFDLAALTNLDDLDKNPVGTYKGQILVGASFGIGLPFGSAIDAEKNFIDTTIYTFTDQELTKTIVINHLNYSFNIFGEYILIDHVGARFFTGFNSVIQRTNFGKDYNNESVSLYNDIYLSAGPAFHLTTRKSWDIALTPFIGFAFANYTPAPIANKLFNEFEQNKNYSQNILIYGAQIEGIYYFDNGVFISSGLNFSLRSLKHDKISRTEPQPSAEFNNGSSETSLTILNVYIAGGYAFYHL